MSLVQLPRKVPSVMVMAMVKAGSRDEKEGQYGGAHFLEHFVFKGTEKYPQVNEIAKEIDSLGGEQNAFTWTDYTGFWVRLAEEHWKKGVEVVGQMVSEPLLPADQLEKEKGTVIEEIRMYEDDPKMKAWNEVGESIFGDTPLGRPILGSEESIKQMRIEDLEKFRENWYWPENMMVLMAGNLADEESIVEEIEKEFAGLKEADKGKREGYNQEYKQEKAKVVVSRKETQQAHLALGMESFAYSDERKYAWQVLDQILGANMSSRLWNTIREKRGLAYYVTSGFNGMKDTGMAYVRAGVRLDKAREAVGLIKDELIKIGEEKVSEEELKRGVEGAKGSLKLSLESSQKTALRVGNSWALTGEIKDMDEVIEKLDKVDRKQVQQVARDVFTSEKMNLSIVGPFEDEDEFEEVLE